MNILIFNWRDIKHSWAGGAEISIFEQASRWAKMGHRIILFCGQDYYRNLPSYEVVRGIHIYRKGGRFSLYIWAIWYYFAHFRGKVDVVVDVENGIPFFTPLFCRLPKLCFVHHVHSKQFFYELAFPVSYVGYFIETYIFPLVYKNAPIMTVSETTKKALVSMGFNKKRIQIIYNGIQKGKNTRKNNVKKFSQPTILYLGRIKAYKRIHLLIEMFPAILKQISKARLLIAGWGTEASTITDLVMRSPKRKRIRLIGPVNDKEKQQLLARSWLFVNPSIGEGWSIAIIEANYYGTPAISFDVHGLSESIQHGKTGLLAKDKEDMIDKISLLLKDKDLNTTLSKNAIAWAAQFTWDRTAKESIRFIERIVKQS